MKYDLIFSDFDGTLARKENEISDRNATAIKEFVKRGGTFVVCTGRMAKSVLPIRKILGTENQLICEAGFHGAHVVDSNGVAVVERGISAEVTQKIIARAKAIGAHVHYYDFYNCFVQERNEIINEYERLTGTPITVVGDMQKHLSEHPDMLVPKIMIVVSPEKMAETKAWMDGEEYEGAESTTSTPIFLEYIPKGWGKGAALKAIAKELDIPLSRTIAIGDNMNDMTMVKTAGLGVAVGNGREELKAVADYVAVNHDEDAVAQVIEKFCGEE
jgi:Cof subfamily protein (haloacid dehalogenase superfamily)